MTHNSSHKSSYRPEIDGLRAIAVVAVIINHFSKDILPSGYLGVDIFFVISGFVITSSLANRSSKHFGDFLLGFYTRRLKRLIPALVLCIVVTSLFVCLFNYEPAVSLETGRRALFGISNIYLYERSTDYFGAAAEQNVFTHTWSLGVEEQFYFLYPFLIWLTGFGRGAAKGTKNLFRIITPLAIISLIGFIYLSTVDQPAAYFLMPPRFWELSAGCLLFLGLKRNTKSLSNILSSMRPLALIFAIVLAMFAPSALAVYATISVVILTVLLIGSIRPKTAAYSLLSHPVMVYIGLMSYSLYLWHWSVLSISRWTIGIHWWSIPIQVCLIVLLAVGSYLFVEQPLRRLKWASVRWRSIVYGIGVLLFVSEASKYGTNGQIYRRFYIGDTDRMYDWGDIRGTEILMSQCESRQEFLSKTLNKCNVDYSNNDPKARQIFLLGDSHARMNTPLLNKLGQATQAKIYFIRCSDVSVPPLIENMSASAAENFDCGNKLISKVSDIVRDGDMVILSSRWAPMFFKEFADLATHHVGPSDQYEVSEKTDGKDALQMFLEKLKALSLSFSNKGVDVVILDTMPEFIWKDRFSPPLKGLCSDQIFNRYLRKTSPCTVKPASMSREFLTSRKRNFSESIISLSNEVDNLFVYDPFPILCPTIQSQCSTSDAEGRSIYLDDDHLSEEGSLSLYDDFFDFLRRANLLS